MRGLDTDVSDSPNLGKRDLSEQFLNQRLKIGEPIGACPQYNNCDRNCGEVLLKRQIAIYGEEHVKLLWSERQEFSILDE